MVSGEQQERALEGDVPYGFAESWSALALQLSGPHLLNSCDFARCCEQSQESHLHSSRSAGVKNFEFEESHVVQMSHLPKSSE